LGQRLVAIVSATVFALVGSLMVTPFALGQTPAQVKTEAKAAPPVPWNKVPESERKVLTPLEKDWAQLGGAQQRKLVGAAKTYPKLAPIQQERFQERIRDWASLTPEQRRAARDKYSDLSRLPPEQQHQLRERWNGKSAQQQSLAPSAAESAPTAPASPK
jgi:Protein of unknown function (DUF3106)